MKEPNVQKLGPYEVIEQLGRGGMSIVYRAYQPSMKREVAVKVLKTSLVDEPDFMERFSREVEVIARLEHPHILPVIDYGESDENIYLVMRLVRGGSLADRLKQGYLASEEANRILQQVASALDYAHRQRVIHRDLKPGNILLDQDDNIYLTDFGIAKILDADAGLTMTGQVMGTPAYISPEQGMGLEIDARADVYALGLVLYEMLTGRGPFTSDRATALLLKHVYEPPPPPSVINPLLPKSYDNVVLKALTKEPEERYQTPLELAGAFEEVLTVPKAANEIAEMKPEVSAEELGGLTPSVNNQPSTEAPAKFSAPDAELRDDGEGSAAEEAAPAVEKTPKRRLRPLIYAAVVLAVIGVLVLVGGRGILDTTDTEPVTATSESTTGDTEIDVSPNKQTDIRAEANASAEALTTVYPGDKLVASGRDPSTTWIWVRFVASGREGWVKTRDLDANSGMLSELPVRNP